MSDRETERRAEQVRWIVEILRSYEVPSHQAEGIAEALIDDGITSLDATELPEVAV